MRTCGTDLSSHEIGTRRYSTSEGSVFLQPCSTGSYDMQCGHEYWKNSRTSILLPDSPGCDGVTVRKSLFSCSGRAVCAKPTAGNAATATSKLRRLMNIEDLQLKVSTAAKYRNKNVERTRPDDREFAAYF